MKMDNRKNRKIAGAFHDGNYTSEGLGKGIFMSFIRLKSVAISHKFMTLVVMYLCC